MFLSEPDYPNPEVSLLRYVDRGKLDAIMSQLGSRATTPGTVYITGSSTALLLGIRDQTIDIDIKLDPEPEGVFEPDDRAP